MIVLKKKFHVHGYKVNQLLMGLIVMEEVRNVELNVELRRRTKRRTRRKTKT